MLRNQS